MMLSEDRTKPERPATSETEAPQLAEGTTTIQAVGGREQHRLVSWDGVTLPVKDWARKLGVLSSSLRAAISRQGEHGAMSKFAEAAERRKADKIMRGNSTNAESDVVDTRHAAGSCANAHRDFAAGDKLEAMAHAYLAYRTLRDVLRRNRFPLEEDEGRRRKR